MSEKKHVLNFIEQAVIDSLYRFQEGLYPKDGELHDEHGNVIESGFLLRESIRPVPKMLLCASLWPKTSADKKTSVGLQGMEAALSVLQEHGLVREMPRPRMVYGAWKRVDGLIFESLETARAGEAKYRIRRANGEPILEADPFTIEGATWTRGYELTSAGIDHARNTQAAPTTAHATKNGEVTITDAMSLKDTPPRPATAAPDGPQPPNLLQFQGKLYKLQPLHWQIVNYMWNRGSAPIEDAIEAIWGADASDNTFRAAVSKVNGRLSEIGAITAIELSVKNGYLVNSALADSESGRALFAVQPSPSPR